MLVLFFNALTVGGRHKLIVQVPEGIPADVF